MQLVGIEICEEFVKLQTMTTDKYGFSDRIQVPDSNGSVVSVIVDMS